MSTNVDLFQTNHLFAYIAVHVLMRDEKEGRKEQASKDIQTIKQSNTTHPTKAVTFSKKNELPWVGLMSMYIHVAAHFSLEK